ncbi:MAG: hypothetical protein HUU46_19265 [Candidatus Hydrogenedentes bacterium]|nr:hypothetical protein [Candidatus Hydrogenedentota bacterium]
MLYRVTWTIDLDADSPEHAARRALEIHRNPDSWATHFEVRAKRGRVHNVDLGRGDAATKQDVVFVLTPMADGIVRDVQAFRTREAAAAAERAWLDAQGIRTDQEREHRSDWGTGIAIWECKTTDPT